MAERIQYSHNYVYTPDGKRRPYKTIFNYKKSGKDFIYDEQTKKWFVRNGKQITDITDKFGNNNYTQVANILLGPTKFPKLELNSTGKRKPAASNESKSTASNGRKPAAATAPRSNFSTPTPTYYTSLEKGITGHGLSEDLKKYLESLGVKSVRDLLERLNTDLNSGLVVDDRWGNKTQDAFKAGYEKWRLQQTAPTERPLPTFDLNQMENWFRQYMLQSQRRAILAMPATYDRYDIRHWLRENDVKGVTAGGRKALRHYLNGEDYDTRYLGIIDLYAPMIKGNQQQLIQSTPTPDPALLDYLNNMMGQSFLKLGNTGSKSYDDMYYYSNGSNLPQQTTSTSSWHPKPEGYWTNKAKELSNQFNFTPQYSTPTYFSNDNYLGPLIAKKGGYIPKFQTAWGTITDMRNYIPSQNQTPNLPGSVALAKATTKIRNEENRKKSSADKRKTKVSGARNMSEMNIIDLQDLLWLKGFFEGTGLTYDKAVDGKMGRSTRQAMERAKQAGYKETEIGMGVKREKPKPEESRSALDYAYTPGTTPSVVQELMLRLGSEIGSKEKTPEEQLEGHAIYLHYPNFTGNSSNALKIGNFDVGEAIGNPLIPVGHDAFVLVDPDGIANYYEYGRYNSGPIIGHKRPTVKGGNWRRIPLPALNPEENDSVYISRVQSMLPDTKTGAYLAMTIPHVDTEKATLYVYDLANDPNRKEYGIDNTCATGAFKATLPFRTIKESHPLQGMFNWGGYSLPAAVWSLVPGSTDSYATTAREAASNVYVMNDKSEEKKKK